MKRIRIALCVLLMLGTAAPRALAANRVVLDATPSVRIDSDSNTTRRRVLSREEMLKARVLIVETDGRYFWATRENRELLWVPSGAAHYFIDPSGGGYVKVIGGAESGGSALGAYQFYEHVSLWMGTITYFGVSRAFEPWAARPASIVMGTFMSAIVMAPQRVVGVGALSVYGPRWTTLDVNER